MDKSEKALILIDESNIYYGFKHQRWELDYESFFFWLKKEFNTDEIYIFGGIITKKAFFDRNRTHTISGFHQCKKQRELFFKKLRKIGYKVRNKPVSSLYDNTSGGYKRKCNFDVEMTIIAMDKINEYDEFVLCSGDGDFIKLVKYLKGKHKKVTVIAHKDRFSEDLGDASNRKIFFRQIKDSLEKKKGLP